jgi:hypothetical protein
MTCDADARHGATQAKPREASPGNVAPERNIIQFPPARRQGTAQSAASSLKRWADALVAVFSVAPVDAKGGPVARTSAERSAEILQFRRPLHGGPGA